ncbi:MAG: hypothetical protein QXL96_09805 [Ignisphaera sp.]
MGNNNICSRNIVVKTLADYMKIGFEKIFKILEEHSKMLEE